jgi:hypothetical protein
VHIDAENADSYEAVWWLNDKGLLIISVKDDSVEIVGLGTSTTTGYMYGIEEVNPEILVIWPLTGGDKDLETFLRK